MCTGCLLMGAYRCRSRHPTQVMRWALGHFDRGANLCPSYLDIKGGQKLHLFWRTLECPQHLQYTRYPLPQDGLLGRPSQT
mmetsp:Transcript_71753/g.126347  ORF Transcript_71753/g.126347 Transcript_71753/m.126347 type:complete len:81 (+) Transcript_71753:682-924(+)